MPLAKGKSAATISRNISEFHGGKTYEHTKDKFGKKVANAQAVAVAMHAAGKSIPHRTKVGKDEGGMPHYSEHCSMKGC